MILRRVATITWGAWLLGVLWMLAMYASGTLQPNFWPLAILLLLQLVGAVAGLLLGLFRLVRGPRRLAAVGWMLLATGPLCLWAAHLSYGIWHLQGRQLDPNLLLRISRPAALAIADAAAHVEYSHRTEGTNVVMIHNGGLVAPEEEVAAMDRHLERMQDVLGKRMRSKVYWVRGPLLGIGQRGGDGWALGSSGAEPHEQGELSYLDAHEAAHAILATLKHDDLRVPADHDTPAVLIEGWAEVQSGLSRRELLSRAWYNRAWGGNYPLDAFLTPLLYRCHNEPVYTQGAVLVDYLLDRYGPEKFFELYMTCTRESFAQDCRRILGVSVEEVDQACGDHLDSQVATEDRLHGVELGEEVDKSLWRELVTQHLTAADQVRELLLSGRLRARTETWTEAADAPSPGETGLCNFELLIDRERLCYESTGGERKVVRVATPECSFFCVLDRDGSAWRLAPEGRQIGDDVVAYRRQRRLVENCAVFVNYHYALLEGLHAVWRAESEPIITRLERVSREGRELVLLNFDNRGNLDPAHVYRSGEILFDPARSWAIRSASLNIEREDGTTGHTDLCFEFEHREGGPPLLGAAKTVTADQGEIPRSRHARTAYDFEPQIDDTDFSPSRYGLSLTAESSPRRRGLSWPLLISLMACAVSIGGGTLTLGVDQWLRAPRSPQD